MLASSLGPIAVLALGAVVFCGLFFNFINLLDRPPQVDVTVMAEELPGGWTLVAYMIKASDSRDWICHSVKLAGAQPRIRFGPAVACRESADIVALTRDDPGRFHWAREPAPFAVPSGYCVCGGILLRDVPKGIDIGFGFRSVTDSLVVTRTAHAVVNRIDTVASKAVFRR